MHRIVGAAVALAFLIGLSGGVDAKQCRDPKTGKYVKCKTNDQMMTKKHCRDPKTGKFIKCKTTSM